MIDAAKCFSLLLVGILAASSLILMMAKPAGAQNVPVPFVPQFTLEVVSSPYYVAPITTINPYTGQNETTQAGYNVENTSIVVTIKNQPFSYSYNGTTYNLYYNVQTKGHFEQDNWNELYLANAETNLTNTNYFPPSGSNTQYTILSYLVGENGDAPFTQLPANAQVDIQVEAVVGYNAQIWVPSVPGAPSNLGSYEQGIGFTTSSGWSPTQTITIVNGSTSSSINSSPYPTLSTTTPPTLVPTSTPTVPEFPTWIILPLFAVIILLSTVFVRKRIPKK